MGERVQVGPLIYTVLESEWHEQLGEIPDLRAPQHRFLALRVSVTNSGIKDSGVPPMELVDPNGETYTELSDGRGLAQWLGSLRILKPAATEHGRVLFDVPSGAYRLRVKEEAELDEEKTALVDIPFQVPPGPPRLPIPEVK